jgi:hypothetical protein
MVDDELHCGSLVSCPGRAGSDPPCYPFYDRHSLVRYRSSYFLADFAVFQGSLIVNTRKLFVLFALFSTSCLAFGQEAVFEEGVISTGDYESHPAFSVTGDTLYFLKMAPDISTWTICTSIRTNNTWSSPVVAPFSGRFRDGDPFITQDGKEFYFVSNRSFSGDSTKRDLDIWRMRKTAQGWSQPMRLPEPINSAADEYYPTLTDQGVLYFSSERGGGDANIYRSVPLNGSYFSVHKMGNQINSEFNEYEPFIAHDESYMIFMSTRPNGLTHGDLYFSQRINGVWQKAIVLPPRPPARELDPAHLVELANDLRHRRGAHRRRGGGTTATKRRARGDAVMPLRCAA